MVTSLIIKNQCGEITLLRLNSVLILGHINRNKELELAALVQ
jgi:hypothetical protein